MVKTIDREVYEVFQAVYIDNLAKYLKELENSGFLNKDQAYSLYMGLQHAVSDILANRYVIKE